MKILAMCHSLCHHSDLFLCSFLLFPLLLLTSPQIKGCAALSRVRTLSREWVAATWAAAVENVAVAVGGWEDGTASITCRRHQPRLAALI